MNPIKLTLRIIAFDESAVHCCVGNGMESLTLDCSANGDVVRFNGGGQLADSLEKNRHQLEKIIHSAVKGRLSVGQTIHCVFIEGFNFIKETDFDLYIRVDRRDGQLIVSTDCEPSPHLFKIYADGSHGGQSHLSGYGGFIEAPDGSQQIFCQSFETGSSNLMELRAVVDGLERLRQEKRIQVNTDSRFVIRGLVQWCHFWIHNDWHTAKGRRVMYADYWQQAYSLCQDKFVEFKWIKGHSGDQYQDFCHRLAKESSTR